MQMRKNNTGKLARSLLPALAMIGMLILAGCATRQPYRNGGAGYGTTYGGGYGSNVCTQCGTVQSIRQVYVQNDNQSHVLGTVIGAVAGGLIGNTVGKGDGRKVATVAGAVAGGAVGHEVAERNSQGQMTAWQVVVRLDNGQFATVTQREAPRAQIGDRVQVRNDHVYLL
ncbi:MAG TPA: glycine zipper 2TM domain-containing protein [Rhodanobacteraceae bacterium]|nr:glycine zipper 2TM domain-containing protein [Rhodanobacteraceae bacterium]HET8553727.1 glycine zipper 2TM domain-containing protein [Rhodanobacteraceae bacterium]